MEKKYLKYKIKYLELKSKIGGGSTYNNLLVTHNSRLRCFLEDIGLMSIIKKKYAIDSKTEIRFKNCSILKISLTQNSTDFTIEMVYEGFVNKRKGIYFVTSNDPINKTDLIFPKETISLSKLGINSSKIVNNYNFYVVRHGEGSHNVVQYINLNTDTQLTNKGIDQAKIAGNELAKFLNKDNSKINFLFSSKLYRTRETLSIMVDQIDILNKDKNLEKKDIIILPCSHELSYYQDGNCDIKSRNVAIPPENITLCNVTTCSIDKPSKCCKVANHISDWSFYNSFYKDGNHCADTNMFKLSINIIDHLKIDNKKLLK